MSTWSLRLTMGAFVCASFAGWLGAEPPAPGGRPSMDRPRPSERDLGRTVTFDRPVRVEPTRPGIPSGRPLPGPMPSERLQPPPGRLQPLRFDQILPTPRCTRMPDATYWKSRDILAEIQRNARRGAIPIIPVPAETKELQGYGLFPAGWRGYGFVVPPGETLKVSLFHPNRGWFRLLMVNKWGDLEKGMLHNVVHTFEPVVTYTNPTRKARAVYVIADDPGWMSYEQNPFTLQIERSWDPTKVNVDDTPVVQGIWTAATLAAKDQPAKG